MDISIIIPTHNEAENIGNLINHLWANSKNKISEIIVSDSDSSDNTAEIAKSLKTVVVKSMLRRRGSQMNKGAELATGEILYFLHADTYPPANYVDCILNEIKNDYGSGCFQLSFDLNHWFLNLLGKFTRLDINALRYGDQSLFIRKDMFQKIQGFNSNLVIMEDNEIIKRIKQISRFHIINTPVITSARKYIINGKYKLQFVFILIYFLYKLGFSQSVLSSIYKIFISDKRGKSPCASAA